MINPVIRVDNLVKRFNSSAGPVYAVGAPHKGITFTAEAGRTTALLGGNGAGKTTTIAMLLGLLLPTSGAVTILGEDMLRHRYRVLPRLNFSSPYVDLPHRLTVTEICGFLAVFTALKTFKRGSPNLPKNLR